MAPFELEEPGSLTEALELLDPEDPAVRPIAGGTALMLMMKSGLYRPQRLVSLRQVERLVDLGQQFVALGVQHLWPVEGDDPEGTFDVERDLPEVADLRRPAIAHARCLLPCRRSPLAPVWLLATVCPGRCSRAACSTMPGNARRRLSGMGGVGVGAKENATQAGGPAR